MAGTDKPWLLRPSTRWTHSRAVVETDGILEVVNKDGEEYGVERLEDVIAANATVALPELAGKIFAAVRAFGRQFDDQTVLIVRRL